MPLPVFLVQARLKYMDKGRTVRVSTVVSSAGRPGVVFQQLLLSPTWLLLRHSKYKNGKHWRWQLVRNWLYH